MVYISNLPYEARWVELKNILREHGGELNWVDILEDQSGRSKGSAVAEFKTREEAEACVRNMGPRYDMNGRAVIVKEIRDPVSFLRKVKEETGVDYLSKGPRGGRPTPVRAAPPGEQYETYGLSMDFLRTHNIELPLVDRIFVANIPFNMQTGRLCDIFSMAGRIKWIDLQMDKEGRSKGACLIEYTHPLEAVQAVSMFNQQKILDRTMLVKLDKFNKPEERRPGELPRGLLTVGMGLGADGAPLKDVASVLSTLGKDFGAQPALGGGGAPLGGSFGGISGVGAPVPTVPAASMVAAPNPYGPPAMSGGMRNGSFAGGDSFGGSGFGMGGSFGNGNPVKIEPPPAAFGGSGNTGSYGGGSRSIVIKNLPHDYTWQIVSDRVASFGDVEGVEMMGPGVARVRYANERDAERARGALGGTVVEGRGIQVDFVY